MQWIDTSDGRRFEFDSGAIALDFIYTAPFATDFETFIAEGTFSNWLTERFPDLDGEMGQRELADVDAVRAAIRDLATAIASGREPGSEAIDVINLYAATPDIPPVLAGSTRRAGRTSIRPAQALSSMAREGIRIFSPENRVRVRQCDASDCQLVFYDDSRAGSRRWCSMQRCGNRSKVRAYRARSSPR
jgi:predicted RNA-binding Zn ribbon-like protein